MEDCQHILMIVAKKIEELKSKGKDPAEIIFFMEGFISGIMTNIEETEEMRRKLRYHISNK